MLKKGISHSYPQMTILPVPKPILQAINKPYMISIQMFHISGDLHEGQAYGITIACIEIFFRI